jgi:hypothetical protein
MSRLMSNDEPVPHQEMPSAEEGSQGEESNFPARKLIKKKNGKQETVRESASDMGEIISAIKKNKDELFDEPPVRRRKTKVDTDGD